MWHGNPFQVVLKMVDNTKHKISFLYIEKAKIHQSDKSIVVVRCDKTTYIPVAQLNALLIGCGVSITTEAIKNISDAGCMVFVCGADGGAIYTIGNPHPTKTKNLLRQIEYYSDTKKHLDIARKMYQLRFPDLNMSKFSINQMRGAEGKRMIEAYKQNSEKYNVEWNGRKCEIDDIDECDIVNRSLTYANHLLYNICYAVISVIGFSPAIGFIHTGNDLSFVYDISDLYKTEITLPVAFQVASKYSQNDDILAATRRELRLKIEEYGLMKKIAKDTLELFPHDDSNNYPDGVCLYNCENFIKSNKNYGR